MDFETLCIHGCDDSFDNTGAVVTPIFQTSTFAHPGVGQSTGYDYSRSGNPTRGHLEKIVATLEGGFGATAFSSGMAAASALMELFSPGDHIVAADDLYGGTHRLFQEISAKNGIKFSFIGCAENIETLILPETKAIFIETPTNPMMNVIDIRLAAEVAHGHGLLLIVDNTFLTPYFQKPIELGADIVLHSGTKFLGGHNDTLAGIVVVTNAELDERLRFISKTTGAILSPFDSFLIERGIKTLAVRMDRQEKTARKLALYLKDRPEVTAIYYPGLPDSKGYSLSLAQSTGFGGMLSFALTDRRLAEGILEGVKLIKYAESLGGTESLITYPMLQTHADIPEEIRVERGITDCLLRLSVGLESPDDLIADFNAAFDFARERK